MNDALDTQLLTIVTFLPLATGLVLLFFRTFYGECRADHHTQGHIH